MGKTICVVHLAVPDPDRAPRCSSRDPRTRGDGVQGDPKAPRPGLLRLLPACQNRRDPRLPEVQVRKALRLGAVGGHKRLAPRLRPEASTPARHRRGEGSSPPVHTRHPEGDNRRQRRKAVVRLCPLCGRSLQPLPKTGQDVGIDLGVCALVATSDGELVTEGRYGRRAEESSQGPTIPRTKRRGSNRRKRAVERVAAAHRKVPTSARTWPTSSAAGSWMTTTSSPARTWR